MKRYKSLFTVLLTIFALAFIVFVGFMQQKFNNPEFSDLSTVQTTNSDKEQNQSKNEDDEDTSDGAAGAASSVVNEDDGDESETDEETVEVTTSTRTVIVDSLNVRSGPGLDYDQAGILVLDQAVEVEDSGDEWVKVTADEITGYVNEKYLSEE